MAVEDDAGAAVDRELSRLRTRFGRFEVHETSAVDDEEVLEARRLDDRPDRLRDGPV